MKAIMKGLGILCFFALLSVHLYAGNTGKIIGTVTDAGSGEAVIGVNILVVGTTRGAVTDFDGKYTIIGVPIGTYVVRASLVGYSQVEYKDVKVGADETTSLNFKMTSGEVTLQGVTITADNLLVNKLATSSTQTVGEKSIQSIPNVKSVEDVLKLQAGVVKQGNNLFLRGGRSNEIQYLVDGVPTNSIVGNSGDLLATSSANQQLAQLYAGVQSGVIGGGASGLAVSANAIQSVSVQTSGFDADYGNAQSGIINIVTKSGGDRYTGSAQFRTDRLASTNQNEAYSAFSIGGPEPLTKYVLPELGAKIPGTITFFLSADMSRSDGPYNFVENDFYNPIERRIELNDFLGGLLNGLGFKFKDNQRNSFTFNSKLKYDISSNDQVTYGYRASVSSRHDFSNDWKYRADSSTLSAGISVQHNLQWQHFFGANSFIRMYFAKSQNHDGNDIAGIKPPDYSSAWELLDVNGDQFNDLGTGQRWYKSLTSVYSYRFDFNSQIHPLHLMKTGFEGYYEEIQSTEIYYPTVPHTGGGGTIIPPDPDPKYQRGEYPGYGTYRWALNQYPNRGGLYIQDNIELAGLNLHVGLRYDYLDIGRQVYYQDFLDRWKEAYKWIDSLEGAFAPGWVMNMSGTTEEEKLSNGRKDFKRFLYYFTHGYFSPRLSIGYPVTDRIVFYFNYGHFYQFPNRDDYYRDPFTASVNSLIGNPSLKPQRNVSYEAGFEDQFTDDMAFSIRAFYKDYFDYSTGVGRGDYFINKNLDYASVRGFEITVNQSFAGNFSTSVSYSYQIAKGRSSNPLAALYQPEFQLPREIRLDWNQDHTANIFATYRVGPREEGHLFGLPFVNNYGISATWSYGSGFPYTGYRGSRVTARNVYLVNGETAPYTTTVNLSFYKGFKVMDNINLLVTFDIVNLLNRRNPSRSAVNPYTHEVYKYGDMSDPSSGVVLPWFRTEYNYLASYNFDAPRQLLIGLRLNWE